jgi:hypothetical protein
LWLESEHLFQIGDGQLRLEYLYVTHRTAAIQPKRDISCDSNDTNIRATMGGYGWEEGDAPVVRFGIIGFEFNCTRCDGATQLLEMDRAQEGSGPRLTGIMQSVSVLLELDSGICAIAE